MMMMKYGFIKVRASRQTLEVTMMDVIAESVAIKRQDFDDKWSI